ncbi:MAG: glycoside hydrolase family 127 protein, partial [Paraprevotella sp.]|nr:glycoside hydrolase family 127 protein [Paraprevotella sp.]
KLKKNKACTFALKIRIPVWVRGQVVPSDVYRYSDVKQLSYSVKVNGQPMKADLQDGYFTVGRKWKAGDRVEVHFDMEPRVVKANPQVKADRGRVAVERGPLVYCAEWPDNDFDLVNVLANRRPVFETVERPDLLYGLTEIRTDAQVLGYDKSGRLTTSDVRLTLIPYYAWAHRGAGNMDVWLPQDVDATTPAVPSTLASESRVEASYKTSALSAVNDGYVPADANDRSVVYYRWGEKKDTAEWISYEFPKPSKVSASTVYWFDDAPWGDCRVPRSWSLYYKDGNGQWQPVAASGTYGTEKGKGNTVNFTPVQTTALKLEVMLPADYSSGLFEWEVE